MVRSSLVALTLLLTACSSSSEPDWQYTAADVEAALVGTWSGTWTAGGKSGSIELVLARAAPSATPKCGSRTLSGPLTPKCVDVSSLALTGTLTTSDGAFTKTTLQGDVMVDGLVFDSGYLALRLGGTTTLTAMYRAGAIGDGRVPLSVGDATFSLARSAR